MGYFTAGIQFSVRLKWLRSELLLIRLWPIAGVSDGFPFSSMLEPSIRNHLCFREQPEL